MPTLFGCMIGASHLVVGHLVSQPPIEHNSLDELPNLQVLVSLDEPYESEACSAWLEDVTRAGLVAAGVDGEAEVSVLITDDETVRALNAEYRGLDETTDVLSFSAEHPGHWEGNGDGPSQQPGESEFILPPGLPRPLGEIIVSWPQAQRQAGEQGVSPMQELAHLVVHGALHLVGYDHVEPEEAALMQARERQALETLSFDKLRTSGG